MGDKRIDPRKQFSKKLAGRAEWFWFFYMILLLALVAFRPEVAMQAFFFAILVTVVMIISVWAYTDNSKFEKGLYATNELAKIKFKWSGNGTKVETSGTESLSDNENEDQNNPSEDEDKEDVDEENDASDDSESIVG